MIKDLREINRVLLAINDLSVNDLAKKDDVINECKKVVLGGKIPNHDDTVNFCISTGITFESNGLLKHSSLGKKFLKANLDDIWDLNEQQKTLLIENCFLDGFCKEETLSILKHFLPDNKRQTFVFSKKDDFTLTDNPNTLQLLLQVELILTDEKLMFVNPNFSKYLSFLFNTRKMTYHELEQKIKIDKEVGDIAEKIILEHEKNRLKNEESSHTESRLVQIISGTDVTAGYDIESFDGKTPNLEFNRFIEVKGSTGDDESFYWSSGEIEKAREKGDLYWIYFVSGIDRKNQSYDGKIIKIPNPEYEVFKTKKYSSECIKFHITKNER